jgi:hypothetical protein
VLAGEVAPAELARMSAADMADKARGPWGGGAPGRIKLRRRRRRSGSGGRCCPAGPHPNLYTHAPRSHAPLPLVSHPSLVPPQELAESRKKREEEHDKEIVLDVETAAKVGVVSLGSWAGGRPRCAVARAPCAACCPSRPSNPHLFNRAPWPPPSTQFSTAAAWETRDVKIKEFQAAVSGVPRPSPPPAPGGAEGAGAPGGPAGGEAEEEGGAGLGEADRVASLLASARAAEEGSQGGGGGTGVAGSGGDAGGGAPPAATRIGSGGAAAAAAAGIDWASVRSAALERQAEAAAAKAAARGGGGEDDDEEGGEPYDPAEGYTFDDDDAAGLGGGGDGGAEPGGGGDDDVPDLGPIVAPRPAGASGAAPRPPGAAVWAGRFATAGAGAFSAVVSYLGGSGPLEAMLGPQVGRVAGGRRAVASRSRGRRLRGVRQR